MRNEGLWTNEDEEWYNEGKSRSYQFQEERWICQPVLNAKRVVMGSAGWNWQRVIRGFCYANLI